jgi:ABC-type multidrug transport system fused ATPase/permease subunit
MVETFRKLRDLLSVKERRTLRLLFVMMAISALVETFTISAMFPFLAVVADPSIVERNDLLSRVYDGLGFTDVGAFLAFGGTAVFLLVVVGLAFATVTHYAIYRFSSMRAASIGRRLLDAYLRQPYAWFLGQHSAEVGASVLGEVNETVQRCMLPAMKLVSQATVAVLLIGLLVAAEPVAAVVAALLIGGVYALIYGAARKRLARMGRMKELANAEKYKVTGEAMGGFKEVKLMGLEAAFLDRFERPARRAAQASAAVAVMSDLPRNALRAITLGAILFFVVVMLLRRDGDLSTLIPILGLYAFAGLRLLPALQQVYASLASMRYSRPVLDKLHAHMTGAFATLPPPPKPDSAAPLPLRDRLELRDVRYAYPSAERGALDGLSLVIPARSTIGIVGGTGAGKTTTVDVILGLLRPQSGTVTVDGEEVTAARLRGWQNSIGYVPQHIFLIDDTVAANIAFGVAPGAIDMAAVERAARIAELHDFVMRELPRGYATKLGERGIRLSGGQRQRVGIARALYRDPEVLVLDEATSALDNLTERAVMDAVRNLSGAKTIIMIAHRLSTVRDCDRIFLLEGGRVAAEGAYDELVATSDDFRRMVAGGRG